MPSDATPKPAKIEKDGDFVAAALDELLQHRSRDTKLDPLRDLFLSDAEKSARTGLQEISKCQDSLAKLCSVQKYELNTALIQYNRNPNDAASKKTIDGLIPGFRGHWDAAKKALLQSQQPHGDLLGGESARGRMPVFNRMSAIQCHQPPQQMDFGQWLKRDPIAAKWLEQEIATLLKPIPNPQEPMPTVAIGDKKVHYPDFAGRTQFVDGKVAVEIDLLRLEDDTPKRSKWLENEEKLTDQFLKAIPERDTIAKEVRRQFDFEMQSPPVEVGHRTYFWKNTGLQNQPVLYATDKATGETKSVLDPNRLSSDGRTAISDVKVSTDGRYFRFELAQGGRFPTAKATWDSENSRYVLDPQFHAYSNWSPQFNGNRHTRFPQSNRSTIVNPFGEQQYGSQATAAANDSTSDTANLAKQSWSGVGVPETGMGRKFEPLVNPFSTSNDGGWKARASLPEGQYALAASDKERVYLMTNADSPHHKLIAVNRETKKVETILPESDKLLVDVRLFGGKLIASYLKDASARLEIHNTDGKLEREIPLPGNGTVRSLHGSKGNNNFHFVYTDFLTPGTVFKYDLKKEELTKTFEAKPPFDKNDFKVERISCKSKDGTDVPMWIVHRKDIKLDGTNPTYITGYGGFALCKTPQFEKGPMQFLNDGGIFVTVNLRGGDEFGDNWHAAGNRFNKQNVFDDMVAAASFLIDNKYTCRSKLAIGGRSNGGLLVGAVMTERPDLFGAAIPEVGVLDMKRFPLVGNGVGNGWISEFGSPFKVKELRNLMKYSPLHNISRGKNYPSTLVMTCENDGIVDPSHSFKFAAALQGDGDNKNPTLLYVAKRTGHGPGKSTEQRIEEYTNKWAFLKHALK